MKVNNETILTLVLTSVYEEMAGSAVKISLRDPSLRLLETNNTWSKGGHEHGRIRGRAIVSVEGNPQLQNCPTDFNIGWSGNDQGGTTVQGIAEIIGIPSKKFLFRTEDLAWGSVEELASN